MAKEMLVLFKTRNWVIPFLVLTMSFLPSSPPITCSLTTTGLPLLIFRSWTSHQPYWSKAIHLSWAAEGVIVTFYLGATLGARTSFQQYHVSWLIGDAKKESTQTTKVKFTTQNALSDLVKNLRSGRQFKAFPVYLFNQNLAELCVEVSVWRISAVDWSNRCQQLKKKHCCEKHHLLALSLQWFLFVIGQFSLARDSCISLIIWRAGIDSELVDSVFVLGRRFACSDVQCGFNPLKKDNPRRIMPQKPPGTKIQGESTPQSFELVFVGSIPRCESRISVDQQSQWGSIPVWIYQLD